jgi:hypothetical protein
VILMIATANEPGPLRAGDATRGLPCPPLSLVRVAFLRRGRRIFASLPTHFCVADAWLPDARGSLFTKRPAGGDLGWLEPLGGAADATYKLA